MQGCWQERGFAAELRLFQCDESADFVSDGAKLNRFIANPDEIVPGNYMKRLATWCA